MHGPAIDRAIFTSVRGRAMDGYQVVATSPGVSADEARDLTAWGPAHDSLLDDRTGAQSIQFHRLSSDRYCISLTTALDAEYSGRGGCQVYTDMLVTCAETLRRFANNPFRLLHAALAGGRLTPQINVPASLEPIHLPGGAAVVDGILLARLARRPGAAVIARFVDAALRHRAVAVESPIPPAQLFAGLFSLLPVECRVEFSFATGLRPSGRRPFRLTALATDAEERRRTTSHGHAIPVELSDSPGTSAPIRGWAGFVARAFSENRLATVSAALNITRPGFTLAGLDALADSLPTSTPALSAVD